MQTMDDMELVREYASRDSQQAFSTLVSRHVGTVYSVALRRVGNPQEAEEIAQAVFIILAKKAGKLPSKTVLSGWLFNTRSNVVRPGGIWRRRPGFAPNCVEKPCQQKRAYDYHTGEHVHEESLAVKLFANRIGIENNVIPEHAKSLKG